MSPWLMIEKAVEPELNQRVDQAAGDRADGLAPQADRQGVHPVQQV